MSSLFLYIATFGVRIYRNRFINTTETLTYFNIITLSIFTWYTIDVDTNQTAVTNIILSVGITFIQFTAVILYHAYKHTNQKLFAVIQASAICIKLTQKKQKRVNHKPAPADEDIHRFYELLDMIDRPVNTNDYNIPQVKPKPAEPIQSVVEPPKPLLVPATPPPLEAIKEETEIESEEQVSKHDDINLIPVKNLLTEINNNKQCISGIEIAECGSAGTNPETEIQHNTIFKDSQTSSNQ